MSNCYSVRSSPFLRAFYFGTIFVAVSSSASATTTRIEAVNQAYLQDETEVFSFPSLGSKRGFFIGELGNSSLQDAYIAGYLKQTGQSGMGFTLSRDAFYQESSYLSTLWTEGLYDTTAAGNSNANGIFSRPENSIEFLYYRQLDRDSRFGLTLSNAEKISEAATSADAKSTRESAVTTLSLGYGMNNWDLTYKTFLRHKLSNTNTAGTNSTEESFNGATKSHTLLARYMLDTRTKVSVGILKSSPDAKFKTATINRSVSFEQTSMVAKVDHAVIQNKNAEIVLSSTLLQSDEKGPLFKAATNTRSITTSNRKSEFSQTLLSASVGFQLDLQTWGMHLLGGISHNVYGRSSTKDKSTEQTATTKTSASRISDPALYSLGLSHISGNLRIDATYERSFLYTGPYFISGNNRGGNQPLLSKIAVRYDI